MKSTRCSHRRVAVRAITSGLVILGLSAFAQQSHAGLFTLVDDNSSAAFNTSSSANTNSWLVDGVDHLNQQAFWYRVGNVAEASLHALPIALEGTTDTDFDGNHENLFVRYGGAGFIAEVRYALDGGSPGSGAADMGEQITITSTSGVPLDFHFFQYVDFDISATPLDDSARFPDPHAVLQYDGSLVVTETADAPQPHRREIDFYNGILAKLTDGVASNLSDTPPIGAVFGPGDVTWAFQWDFTLLPNSVYQISKDKIISVIPEPAASFLLSFGAGLLLSIRRKR